jgi:acetyl esterase/lipase
MDQVDLLCGSGRFDARCFRAVPTEQPDSPLALGGSSSQRCERGRHSGDTSLSAFLASAHAGDRGLPVGQLYLPLPGRQVAEWLNNLGIAAFVLKYRVAPTYHYPVPLLDAQRALRYVRSNASLYNVVENQIGIMGFSAGGHLAAMVATHFDTRNAFPRDSIDRLSARPDFLVLIYPVITCSEPFLHAFSCSNLLGDHPDASLAALVSNEKHVTPQTPPTFLFHTYDDATVPVENSLAFATALHKAGVPTELHIYEHGQHNVGLALDDPILSTWPKLLENWFRVRGLLPMKAVP